MRILSIFITLLILQGCGNDYVFQYTEDTKSEGLEGYFYFDLGGEVEILKDAFNRYTITQVDYLTSINPDNDSFAIHPKTNATDKFPTQSNSILFSLDVTYLSGNDVEKDINGGNILGKKRTDFKYELDGNNIKLTIKIFNNEKINNPDSIIATRILTGKR